MPWVRKVHHLHRRHRPSTSGKDIFSPVQVLLVCTLALVLFVFVAFFSLL